MIKTYKRKVFLTKTKTKLKLKLKLFTPTKRPIRCLSKEKITAIALTLKIP